MRMATHVEPLAESAMSMQPAWNALATHYEQVSKMHLRQLFADDPKRGERMAVEAVGLYLDYSKNRVTDETLGLLLQLAEESGLRTRIGAMLVGRRSTSRKNAQSYTPRCEPRRARRSWSMERTLYPKCMRCSAAWLTFRIAYAGESGRATAESAFATSSISASEARTWAR